MKGQNCSDFVTVESGIGVSAAFYLQDTLYRSVGETAGEIGYMTAREDGPLCECGNWDCCQHALSSRERGQTRGDVARSSARQPFRGRSCLASQCPQSSTYHCLGRLGEWCTLFLETVRTVVPQRALHRSRGRCEIVLSSLAPNGGVIGAAR